MSMKVGSERYYFMMDGNADQYEDGKRCLFCDELEEYTFFPYGKGLKKVPGYLEHKEAFEEMYIFILYHNSDKPVRIPCNVFEERKQIYIAENNFNKYWKTISKSICMEVRKNKNSNNVTLESMNQKVDLSLLENSCRMAKINSSFEIEYKGKETDIEIQRLISKRASALQDNRIRFVYAKSDQLIHDKTCPKVEKIEYWDFGAEMSLPENRTLCPQCRKRIYIRNAIQSDTKHFQWYLHFFENGRVSKEILKRFLYQGNAKLHMENKDEIRVKYKEDTWLIKVQAQGRYTLRHNNYVMVSEEERYITSGFHVQKNCPPYLPGILAYIEGYDWQKHLQMKHSALKEKQEEKELVMSPKEPEKEKIQIIKEKDTINENSRWRRLKSWLEKLWRRKKNE